MVVILNVCGSPFILLVLRMVRLVCFPISCVVGLAHGHTIVLSHFVCNSFVLHYCVHFYLLDLSRSSLNKLFNLLGLTGWACSVGLHVKFP